MIDKNTTLEMLLDDGYSAVDALQLPDAARNNDNINHIADGLVKAQTINKN